MFNFTQLMARQKPDEVGGGKGRCVGHLRVTTGHIRVTMGHLRLIIGYLKATVVLKTNIRQTQLSFTPK